MRLQTWGSGSRLPQTSSRAGRMKIRSISSTARSIARRHAKSGYVHTLVDIPTDEGRGDPSDIELSLAGARRLLDRKRDMEPPNP